MIYVSLPDKIAFRKGGALYGAGPVAVTRHPQPD